mmetsp:Transcript_30039/g.48535  ORF Transcript_30039/g.48535 Transcript_30039/m.48535 type:complete len:422 (-) Transcript_30039:28-1293(-)
MLTEDRIEKEEEEDYFVDEDSELVEIEEEEEKKKEGEEVVISEEQIHRALRLASKYFQAQLMKNKKLLRYLLEERCLTRDTLTTFELGYSPDSSYAMSKFLREQYGFMPDLLKSAGVVKKHDQSPVDFFQNRMMIPIHDEKGRHIAFGARLTSRGASRLPKYLNSSNNTVFQKSHNAFNIHRAAPAIREEDSVIIVEGYMDVIALHQAGIFNVIACMGTSNPWIHIYEAATHSKSKRVYLLFDGDEAGLRTSARLVDQYQEMYVDRISSMKPNLRKQAWRQGWRLDLMVASLPSGFKDAGDLLEQHAMHLFVPTLEKAVSWLEFYLNDAFAKCDPSDSEAVAELEKEGKDVISTLPRKADEEHYSQLLNSLIEELKLCLQENGLVRTIGDSHGVVTNLQEYLAKKTSSNASRSGNKGNGSR